MKSQKKISELLFYTSIDFCWETIENNQDYTVLELFNLAVSKSRLKYGEEMNRSQGLALNLAP